MRRVEVRLYGTLSDSERQEIELEENLRRKDLTAFERAKATAARAEAAKEAAAEAEEVFPESGKTTNKGGRPTKGRASLATAAERTGIPLQTIHDAESHVAAAERYPFLQGAAWSQVAAMREKQHERPSRAALTLALTLDPSRPSARRHGVLSVLARALPSVAYDAGGSQVSSGAGGTVESRATNSERGGTGHPARV
ncbi:MAG: hypothetical protein HY721_26890 [Planctomycetes bacterium]|nr:hypothetical protein [Planctomycetota bacterium]